MNNIRLSLDTSNHIPGAVVLRETTTRVALLRVSRALGLERLPLPRHLQWIPRDPLNPTLWRVVDEPGHSSPSGVTVINASPLGVIYDGATHARLITRNGGATFMLCSGEGACLNDGRIFTIRGDTRELYLHPGIPPSEGLPVLVDGHIRLHI